MSATKCRSGTEEEPLTDLVLMFVVCIDLKWINKSINLAGCLLMKSSCFVSLLPAAGCCFALCWLISPPHLFRPGGTASALMFLAFISMSVWPCKVYCASWSNSAANLMQSFQSAAQHLNDVEDLMETWVFNWSIHQWSIRLPVGRVHAVHAFVFVVTLLVAACVQNNAQIRDTI